MRVAFYTLGCKLNQAETESLVDDFSRAGFQVVASDAPADIYIANTCTVTHIADRKSRHWLRASRRRNPRAVVIATGCYAQRDHRELAKLADLVVGNEDKKDLVALTRTLVPDREVSAQDRSQPSQTPSADTRVRSLVKIQDGCQCSCAYCIVPSIRPHEYSLPAYRIVEEIQQRIARGYREVVLTGTRVGSYWSNGTDLKDLVQRILCSTNLDRLRLSSLQPSDISPGLLTLWEDERLCRHFHLALQSGSEHILHRMGRGYSPADYQRALDLIREMIPEASVTTDVIVGFPGETDKEFGETCSFCRHAGFADIHVFPFSARPGTAAAGMMDQIGHKFKQERTQQMLELSRTSRQRSGRRFLGRTMQVLWEKETSPGSGMYSGLTGNYLRVFARSETPLSNEITSATLIEAGDQGMRAEVGQLTALR